MQLSREDYEEPACVLCKPDEIRPIPVGRALGKLDEYLEKNDYEAAERHLKYWIAEAEAAKDLRGKLTLVNETIGLYRKTEKKGPAFDAIQTALSLLDILELSDTVIMATTYINAATAYRAFGESDEALPLYEKARELYEKLLNADDPRLGGLYNNMALTVMEKKEFDRAEELFKRALAVMEKTENGELECAITWCNLADLTAARCGMEKGEEEIGGCLEKAMALLNTGTLPRNGYYAFVSEKCAPTFAYYGYFMDAGELKKRAETIYEGA